MSSSSYVRCLMVEKTPQGGPTLHTRRLPEAFFDHDQVTIDVHFSSLNFKDTLACQGHRGVIRSLPHIPGIDLAGQVVRSSTNLFEEGDLVLVTGYDLGQGHWGGWSQRAAVPADWIVKLPAQLSCQDAMFIGTAGFTAAQCLQAILRNEVQATDGPLIVTGASGGVGSLAVRLLAQAGYQVVAVTRKLQHAEALKLIGATQVISRQQFLDVDPARPMLKAQWSGGVDTVGGEMLTTLLRSTRYGGCVAACGLVAGNQLQMSLYPFLLRGVNLCGVASADCPMEKRLQLWKMLAGPWKPMRPDLLSRIVGLENMPELVQQMSQGEIAGRVIIDCQR